jgi:uncharacterized FlaG/YvyC family protein
MNEQDQIGHFNDDLQRLLDKYSAEFDMSLASQVGTLMCKIYELISSSYDEEDDDDDEVEV